MTPEEIDKIVATFRALFTSVADHVSDIKEMKITLESPLFVTGFQVQSSLKREVTDG